MPVSFDLVRKGKTVINEKTKKKGLVRKQKINPAASGGNAKG